MVSVIIPVYNEEHVIVSLLNDLLSYRDIEIIVVDGGSTDGTIHVVERFSSVKLVISERGRANQLNQGGYLASGDILFFIHADSILPECAIPTLIGKLMDSAVVAGSFSLKFDHSGFWLNVFSGLSGINHIFFTYGDQGLFLRKKVFCEIGGYADLPIMEDFEIQRRLRKRGKFVKLNAPITTSARRYNKYGVVKQQLKNIFLVLMFLIGVSPEKLAKHYKYE